MTILQMRNLTYKKPDEITWDEWEKMEVSMTGMGGLEFISEFEDKTGVTMLRNEAGDEKLVFNFVSEEVHEQLMSPDELDELCLCGCESEQELVDDESLDTFNALPELTMLNHEYIAYDKN